jgi:hypothetical protein
MIMRRWTVGSLVWALVLPAWSVHAQQAPPEPSALPTAPVVPPNVPAEPAREPAAPEPPSSGEAKDPKAPAGGVALPEQVAAPVVAEPPAPPSEPSPAVVPTPSPVTPSPLTPAPAAQPPTPAPPAQSVSPPSSAWNWARPSPPGNPPAADTAVDKQEKEEDDEVPPRVPWKGTAFAWTHAITTSKLGIGSDYISTNHQVYTQGYSVTLNYYVVDNQTFKWRVSTQPGFDLELTDSDETTRRHEAVVRDLPLTTVAIGRIYKPEDENNLYAASWFANLTAIVPTSKYTRGAGDILTLSPRLSLFQVVPLLGKDAPALQSLLIGVGGRYDALFSQSTVSVSDEVRSLPRQVRSDAGTGAATDVLSGTRLAPHTGRVSAFMMLSEKVFSMPINFVAGINYSSAQLYELNDGRRTLPTGEIEIESVGRNSRPSAGVGASLAIFPLADFTVSVGYSNTADLNGPTPNIWYTPQAQFTGAVAVSLDAIYERMTGPARTIPFILF